MNPVVHSTSQTSSPYHIYDPRRFQHARTEAVLGLIPEGETQHLGHHFAQQDPWARLGITSEYLKVYFSLKEEWAPRYAILIENQVAGVVGLRMNWLKGPYLQFLGLLPNFQNHGLGSAALNWLIDEARRHKEPNVWVCASSFNSKALAFYEKRGFDRIACLEELVTENENEVLLRLRLT